MIRLHLARGQYLRLSSTCSWRIINVRNTLNAVTATARKCCSTSTTSTVRRRPARGSACFRCCRRSASRRRSDDSPRCPPARSVTHREDAGESPPRPACFRAHSSGVRAHARLTSPSFLDSTRLCEGADVTGSGGPPGAQVCAHRSPPDGNARCAEADGG